MLLSGIGLLFRSCPLFRGYTIRGSILTHITIPAAENPSCLQTTLASRLVHPSSHTVPHTLSMQISTRPSRVLRPDCSLTSPSVHSCLKSGHLTPASCACVQVTSLELLQFVSSVSFPVHSTLSSHILPVPSPKPSSIDTPVSLYTKKH